MCYKNLTRICFLRERAGLARCRAAGTFHLGEGKHHGQGQEETSREEEEGGQEEEVVLDCRSPLSRQRNKGERKNFPAALAHIERNYFSAPPLSFNMSQRGREIFALAF